MVARALSLTIEALFLCILGVILSGGFLYEGSVGTTAFRLDTRSPDLFVLLFLVLLGVWHFSGRNLQDLRPVGFLRAVWAEASSHRSPWPGLALVSLAAVFIALPLLRHYSFFTGYDLALFGQAYWNTLHGDLLFSSIKDHMVLWGDHFNPIVLGILPFYWIWPSPETLLVIQSLALLAGAIPLFLLARSELGNHGLATVIAFAYLLHLPLRQANIFDFHPIVLAPPLILAAFYFMRNGAWWRFVIFSVLVGATKETGPIAIGLLGAASLYLSSKRWLGAVLVATAIIWFVVNLAVVMPTFNPSGVETQLARYSYLGDNAGEILRTLVTRPLYAIEHNLSSRELFYPVRILGPVSFLPLLTPLGLLTVPYLAINLLEGTGVQVWLVHYQAELAAFVFIATVFGAKRALQHCSSGTLAAAVAAGTFLFFGTADVYRLREAVPTPDTHRIHSALKRLPSGGRVSAQAALAPHLTQRKWLYVFPEVSEADWIVVDYSLDRWPVEADRFNRFVKKAKRQGFRLDFRDEKTRILRRRSGGRKQRDPGS